MSNCQYVSLPSSLFHLGRVVTHCKIFQLPHFDFSDCRVLELGCGVGATLLGLATQYPSVRFTGVDTNPDSLNHASQLATQMNLSNIEFKSATDLSGKFDCILTRDVLTQNPSTERAKLLKTIKESLSQTGYALLSYKVLPGAFEEQVAAAASGVGLGGDQVTPDSLKKTEEFLRHLAQQRAESSPRLSRALTTRAEILSSQIPRMIWPLYFLEFISLTATEQLKYLGEIEYGKMRADLYPEQVKQFAKNFASTNIARFEQLLDLADNRAFRCSLLGNSSLSPQRKLQPKVVEDLHVGLDVGVGFAKDTFGGDGDIALQLHGVQLVLSKPSKLIRIMLHFLNVNRGRTRSFNDLLEECKKKGVNTSSTEQLKKDLGLAVLNIYARGLVSLLPHPGVSTTVVSDKPIAYSFARHYAAQSPAVVNPYFQVIGLSDSLRKLICLLDGKKTIADLSEERGQLSLKKDLEALASLGLLVG